MSRETPLIGHIIVFLFVIIPILGHTATEKEDVVQVRVDTSRPEPWKRRLHGFNTNMISGLYAYGDEEFRHQTSRLKPTLLRFPGGSVGNFYRWERRGFTAEDMTSTASKKNNKRNINNLALLRKRRKGIIDFDEFMLLCRELGAQAIVVVNVYTGTPQESAAWVRHAKEAGYKVAGWELGNEIYLPFYRNRFPSVQAYIEEAKRHAVAMRAVHPEVRLAVPVHPAGFHLHDSSRYAHNWNSGLAAETFYDAYVVHPYLKTHKYLDKKQASRFNTIRNDLFALSEVSFRQAVRYYGRLFGDREIWLTEWNLTEKKGHRVIGDTLLHALYVADFVIQLIQTELPVTFAGYNTLAGRWNGFPTFTPRNKGAERADSSIRRASYYAFELLGKTLAETTERYAITIANAPKLPKSEAASSCASAVSAAAVGMHGAMHIPIVNRSDQSLQVRLITDGKDASGPKTYHVLSASRLEDRGGKNQLTIERSMLEGALISVPANSLGVIEVR